jgi:hypothetical protein
MEKEVDVFNGTGAHILETYSPIFDSLTGKQISRGIEIKSASGEYFGMFGVDNMPTTLSYAFSKHKADDFIYVRLVFSNAKATKESKKRERTKMTPKLRYDILKRDNFTCVCCGAKAPSVNLEVDHILPISKGGKTTEKNLQTLCFLCNRGKFNSHD